MDSFSEYISFQKADIRLIMKLLQKEVENINFDLAGKNFPNEVVIK